MTYEDGYRPGILVVLAVLLCGCVLGTSIGCIIGWWIIGPCMQPVEWYSERYDDVNRFFAAAISGVFGARQSVASRPSRGSY